MQFTITKATKIQSKARIGLVGPAGSGKTYSALAIAGGLGGRIAVIDTENASAAKYAGLFDFDVLALDTFAPRTYVEAIHAVEDAGYDVLIIDSLSHAWSGKGGALEMVDAAAKRSQGNSYVGWRDVTPEHNRMVEAMVRCKCHLIVTMRSKMEYVLDKDERTGRTTPKKVGMAPVQRDGLEYEFDIAGDMDLEHNWVITKTRCSALDGMVLNKPGAWVAQQINAWLSEGAAPVTGSSYEPPSPSVDDLIDLPEFAAAVKKLRECERAITEEPPPFVWKKKDGRLPLEDQYIESRMRLYTWLVDKGVGNGDGTTLPDLSELDDKSLMDLAYAAAGL